MDVVVGVMVTGGGVDSSEMGSVTDGKHKHQGPVSRPASMRNKEESSNNGRK